MRKLLIFIILGISVNLNAQFKFYRTDSIPVLHTSDTLDYAWAAGMNFCQFSDVDMNLDGIKDLLVFDRTFNQCLTFINLGIPGQIKYRYQPYYESKFPTTLANWVLMRDYNCDGKEDIFGYTPGGITIYKNISDTALKFEQVVTLLRGVQCINYVNIYVSSVDIPGIEDIDYDGDLDILTFGIFGTFLEYHKNYSVELGYGCDSLKFTMKNQCWGHFREDTDSCIIYLHQTQSNCAGVGTPELGPYNGEYDEVSTITEPERGATRHTGSAILPIDMNGINAKDILVTDVSCNNVAMLLNAGTAPNLDTDMDSADVNFPSYDVPVNVDIFPGSYYEDVNNDGQRDLICAPNSYVNSNNFNGNWLYLNTSSDTVPLFMHDQYGFMQNQMIERGEGSLPVFFDYNMDGLKDLVISNFGYFDPSGIFIPKLGLYKNIGTAAQPSYQKVNDDYANVYASINKQSLYPAFGDLDNDGDEDMILGDSDGNLHYFTNTAGVGNPAVFSLTTPLMTDNMSTVIDVGKFSTPTLIDIDRDGDKDLVIGEQNANLNYYQNTGTLAAPVFKYITDNFGDVHVNESWTPIGYSVPAFYDHSGSYSLFVGSQKGVVYQYTNIDGNLGGNFTLIDSMLYTGNGKIGGRVGVAVDLLNTDTLPDLIAGTYRGGLALYFGDPDGSVSIKENPLTLVVNVYPNPVSSLVTFQLNKNGYYYYTLHDLNGKSVLNGSFNGSMATVDLNSLTNGLYLLKINDNQSNVITHKLIKHSGR